MSGGLLDDGVPGCGGAGASAGSAGAGLAPALAGAVGVAAGAGGAVLAASVGGPAGDGERVWPETSLRPVTMWFFRARRDQPVEPRLSSLRER